MSTSARVMGSDRLQKGGLPISVSPSSSLSLKILPWYDCI
jgi:hypothetical protein